MTSRIKIGSPLCMFALVALGCASPGDQGDSNPLRTHQLPVVGGQPALPSEYPSTVALVDSFQGSPFCTGTLVAPTVVVTAAHCLQSWPPTNFTRVVYGFANPQAAPASERRPITKRVAHPQYKPNAPVDADGLGVTNDIGVVILKDPIPNALVTPILPQADIDPELPDWTASSHQDVDVAGYGIYDLPNNKSGLLYKARTPHIRHIPTEMLAGRPGEPDTCNGDSGGPVYLVRGCSLWLVGVTSRAWAGSSAQCGDGGIYTIPSAYVSWIETASGVKLPAPDSDGGGLPTSVCEDDGGVPDSGLPDATDASDEQVLPESGPDAPDAWDGKAGAAGTGGTAGSGGTAGKGGAAGAGGKGGSAGASGKGGSAGQPATGGSGGAGKGGSSAKGGASPDAGQDASSEASALDEASIEGGSCSCSTRGDRRASASIAAVGLLAVAMGLRRRRSR